jgi:hypothetical protein
MRTNYSKHWYSQSYLSRPLQPEPAPSTSHIDTNSSSHPSRSLKPNTLFTSAFTNAVEKYAVWVFGSMCEIVYEWWKALLGGVEQPNDDRGDVMDCGGGILE